MPNTVGGIVVDPLGQTLVVDLTNPRGNRPPWYDGPDSSSVYDPTSFPRTITTRTKFFTTVPGTYILSAKLNGQEIAGQSGNTISFEVASRSVSEFAPTAEGPIERAAQSGTSSAQLAAAIAAIPVPVPPESLSGVVYSLRTEDLDAGIVQIADTGVGVDSASSLNGRSTTFGDKAWVVSSGTMGISSNKIYASALSAGYAQAYFVSGVTEAIWEGTFLYLSAADGPYFSVRGVTDDSNRLYVKLAGTPQLRKTIATVDSLIAQGGALVNNTSYRITIKLKGLQVQVLIDGALTITGTLTVADAAALTGTNVKIIVASTSVRVSLISVYTADHVDGMGVSSWPNAAPALATARQTLVANLPTFRVKSGVRYVSGQNSGAGLDLEFPSMSIGEQTIFLVGKAVTSPTTDQHILNLGGPTALVADMEGSTFIALNSTGPEYTGLVFPAADGIMVMSISAAGFTGIGAGAWIDVNGASVFRTQDANSAAPATTAVTTGFIGGRAANQATQQFLGDLRAVAIFNRKMERAEIAQVQAFLARKYAITLVTPTRVIVFEGDSLTAGQTGTTLTTAYPDYVINHETPVYRAYNMGVTGQTLTQMASDAATQTYPLYDSTMSKNIAVVWGGTNDMTGTPSNPTAAYNSLASLCAGYRTAGFKVIVVTCAPRGAVAQFETDRTAFNTLVRANWATFADALADVGADATIGVAGAQNNGTYYQGDAIHMKAPGYTIVAGLVRTAIATL